MVKTLMTLLAGGILYSSSAVACVSSQASDRDNYYNCSHQAIRGDAKSQYELGMLYSKGIGVPQNQRLASMWIKKSAVQGLSAAQHELGLMYWKANGVRRDAVLSLMWVEIATQNGNRDAVASRDTLKKLMSPNHIKYAEDLSREWISNTDKNQRSRSQWIH